MDVPTLLKDKLAQTLSPEDRITLTKMSEDAAATDSKTVDFSKPWAYADIVFCVEDRRIYASKMILCMWSPVFEAMFSDNFKERNAKEIKLPDKSFADVLEMMRVLHPPNQEITEENVTQLLPLLQEYQMETLLERAEEFLIGQASSVRNFILAQKFNLLKLQESNLSYLKRAPVSRLKTQPDFELLEPQTLIDLLIEKCEKFETNMDSLREVRMVLERKKPTTFPGMHLLCDDCTSAREQQVDCGGCMKSCCKKITDILRSIER